MSGESDQEVPKMSTLLHEYREKFRELVEAIAPGERDRLVIMIDDLDRVTPIRAIELLEAIKNFLDVPKCVFVLAVDYAVIQQGVADRLDEPNNAGKSYFDKLFRSHSICLRRRIEWTTTSSASWAGIYAEICL